MVVPGLKHDPSTEVYKSQIVNLTFNGPLYVDCWLKAAELESGTYGRKTCP